MTGSLVVSVMEGHLFQSLMCRSEITKEGVMAVVSLVESGLSSPFATVEVFLLL